MAYVFWVIVASVVAVISHISVLLFAPSYYFDSTLSQLSENHPRNKFFVLSAQGQQRIFPEFPSSSIFGLCRYDLKSGPVALHANLPHTFWTLTIYSPNGKTLYTVNDRQTGADMLDLQLVKAPTIFEIFSAKDDDDVVEASVWRVSSANRKGLALIWAATADPAERDSFIEIISKSSCTAPNNVSG